MCTCINMYNRTPYAPWGSLATPSPDIGLYIGYIYIYIYIYIYMYRQESRAQRRAALAASQRHSMLYIRQTKDCT